MPPIDWALAAAVLLSMLVAGFALRRVAALGRKLSLGAPRAGSTARGAIQRVGLLRYQAYHDVGGDHSFALALLDDSGAGVVVNSLYHRDRCRVYAKPVELWGSPLQLTVEEQAAIDRARASSEPVGQPSRGRR